MVKINRKAFGIVLAGLFFFAAHAGFSQNQRRIVQLSGIILQGDSVSVIPGATIYIPKAGRGTTSNNTGFFSLPVQTGDSVLFSSVGYVTRHMIVPDTSPEFSTVIIEMTEDVTRLPTVEIFPYPTEEVFKEAVLAMNIPMDENGVDKKNLNAELMALMVKTTPMDAKQNYNYYLNQYPGSIQNKFMPITNPFLNVFNWAKFLKQMKQQKKDKEKENN